MTIQEKVNKVLEEIEFEIDRANKLMNCDRHTQSMQEERLRYIDVLYKAGELVKKIAGGAISG
jgi:hypothetical protein